MFNNKNSDLLAAIDLGSNSFHMTVARVKDGQLTVIDTLKEMVRLASGITSEHDIEETTAARALACLQRFGQRIHDIPARNIRAIGTNAFRRAGKAKKFNAAAEKALGCPIQVISGMEEARLIYLGVQTCHPLPGQTKLVVDIGGGSTELIVGRDHAPDRMESLYMGCVGFSHEYFTDGKITPKRFQRAVLAAHQELEPVANGFRDAGWSAAIGSSGTARSIAENCIALKLDERGITLQALCRLREHLLEAGDIARHALPSLPAERAPVFAGGLAILIAVFEALEIRHMIPSACALREGILYEMSGRMDRRDIRDRTIAHLCRRYQVDSAQAERVRASALKLLESVRANWALENSEDATLLGWAAQLHEIGLTVSHSRYHHHSGYIVEHSDLPGFAREEQRLLAALVRLHRRKPRREYCDQIEPGEHGRLLRLAALLRLSAVLHRSRLQQALPEIAVSADSPALALSFPPGWLEAHPLTEADLQQEAEYLKAIGIELKVR
jgi:exopolyphosphatase / guanosine-5'-triphosphate,3'-diphosphate pyrophosphatase